ncbi:hypothetical protein MLD38_026748 [Melastoma candidum]|uniref:Uncharacterized protein n=1 Tax=Melastoma candidum TaxID=119954 RepID=A0ACB9P0H2_9MYRT|nr:hypothetical protein MLD38_026748 [Melastoma candidum]
MDSAREFDLLLLLASYDKMLLEIIPFGGDGLNVDPRRHTSNWNQAPPKNFLLVRSQLISSLFAPNLFFTVRIIGSSIGSAATNNKYSYGLTRGDFGFQHLIPWEHFHEKLRGSRFIARDKILSFNDIWHNLGKTTNFF